MKVLTQEIKSFPSAPAFREWLASHHGQAGGIWLRFIKKTSGEKSLTYPEALDEALCYGWIDGQAKAYDERSWVQRFTPRRTASSWSKINTQRAERLDRHAQIIFKSHGLPRHMAKERECMREEG